MGSASGATMTNCYATGLIGGTEEQTAKRGAFAGSLTSPTLSENKFYEIINNTLPPVGNVETVEEEQIVALDKDLDTFKAFYAADARTEPGEPGAKPTRLDKAVPYDSQLAKLYKQDDDSIYPLRTIRMLNPDATDEWKTEHYWATSHYGDWPAPETLVVNTQTS